MISREALDYVLGEDWDSGEYTVRDELGKDVDNVVYSEERWNQGILIDLKVWTKKNVYIMVNTGLGSFLIDAKRNPKK